MFNLVGPTPIELRYTDTSHEGMSFILDSLAYHYTGLWWGFGEFKGFNRKIIYRFEGDRGGTCGGLRKPFQR